MRNQTGEVAVREVVVDRDGSLGIRAHEILVVETEVERILFVMASDGKTVQSTRYSKPGREGRPRVLRPEDRHPAVTPRMGSVRLGDPLGYSVRGLRLDGKATPRRTAPVTGVRAVSMWLPPEPTPPELDF